MDTESLLQRIKTYPGKLRKVSEQLGGKALNASASEGSWRVRQILHHIADVTMLWSFHIRRILVEQNPQLAGMQQDRLARLADYQLADTRTTPSIINGVYERLMVLLRNIKPEDWRRTAHHEKYGEMTLAGAIDHLLEHNEHHLDHIEQITKG